MPLSITSHGMKSFWPRSPRYSSAVRPWRASASRKPRAVGRGRSSSTGASRRSPRDKTPCTSAHSGESALTSTPCLASARCSVFWRAWSVLAGVIAIHWKGVCALGTNGVALMAMLRRKMARAFSVRSTMPWMSSSFSVGWPTMKYIFNRGKPSACASSTAASRSASVCRLLITVRSRSVPASGAMVSVCVPLAAIARTSGTLIGSVRIELTVMRAPMPCSSVASSSICEWSETAAETRPMVGGWLPVRPPWAKRGSGRANPARAHSRMRVIGCSRGGR